MHDEDMKCECTIEWVFRCVVEAFVIAVCLLALGAAIFSNLQP